LRQLRDHVLGSADSAAAADEMSVTVSTIDLVRDADHRRQDGTAGCWGDERYSTST